MCWYLCVGMVLELLSWGENLVFGWFGMCGVVMLVVVVVILVLIDVGVLLLGYSVIILIVYVVVVVMLFLYGFILSVLVCV